MAEASSQPGEPTGTPPQPQSEQPQPMVWEIDFCGNSGPKKTRKKSVQKKWESNGRTKEGNGEVVGQASNLPVVELQEERSALIPKNLTITREQMAQRKYLSNERWFCISRPQYKYTCGISSLTSCFNYLYSTLGNGELPPISQEEAMELLGFEPPFGDIRFGPFTGNKTLIRWFAQLCRHYGVQGKGYYFWKLHGLGRTGRSAEEAWEMLTQGLRSTDQAFIYHCHNHYFCPIGYEEEPVAPTNAYQADLGASDLEPYLLIGEPSKRHPPIHVKKWKDVVTDISCQEPYHFNIRNTSKGVYKREKAKHIGGNLHCIIAFSKTIGPTTFGLFDGSDSEGEEPEPQTEMASDGEDEDAFERDAPLA